ncbi:MAG: hypothetical protein H6980_04815 [Gammaproteobacteria bacterium]|nr:hypothetical protein [Gammaproteobacteria bacterium]
MKRMDGIWFYIGIVAGTAIGLVLGALLAGSKATRGQQQDASLKPFKEETS